MICNADLTCWANVAAIAGFLVTLVGAIVGIRGYNNYQRSWKKKTAALVTYLKDKKKTQTSSGKKGQQTATHLIRYVGLTEDEILKISFESKQIKRSVGTDEEGNADTLYFEYKG